MVKSLVFVEMRMLHWPDSMATHMTGDNILFSNDAFGQHYAVEELWADKADQCRLWAEAMKYYANILNPFSPLVKAKLKKFKSSTCQLISSLPAMVLFGVKTQCKSLKNTTNGLKRIKKTKSQWCTIQCGMAQRN